jgi:hypothetical protein
MPNRIRCRDKMSTWSRQRDISMVKTETKPFSQVSDMAFEPMFEVLYGSI